MEQVRNIVGKPVVAGDFVNREKERADLARHIELGNSVLLTAPRRVGKSSLLRELCRAMRKRDSIALYVDAGGLTELQLISELADQLSTQDASLFKKMAKPIREFFDRVKRLGFLGLTAELTESSIPSWQEAGDALISALESQPRCVIVIDEISVMLMAMLRAGERGRAETFLWWLKRQRDGDVVWFLAGSISLDAVIKRARLSVTLGGLYVYDGLGAFSREDAIYLLDQLGASEGMVIEPDVAARVCERIGWLIPYYVQLLFCMLRESWTPGSPPPDRDAVDAAYERLLAPSREVHFAPWMERLHDELGPPYDGHAVQLLNVLALHPDGFDVVGLRGALASHLDQPELNEQLRFLLYVLENDGYIVRDGELYRFRSPLLCDVWAERLKR